MFVDGIEITRLENEKCYLVDENYILVADNQGNIKYIFNMKFNEENIKNFNKDVAQNSILRYDIIKKIQEEIN